MNAQEPIDTMRTLVAGDKGLLRVASEKYEDHLDLDTVARIWQGGCIIRASQRKTSARPIATSPACRIFCSTLQSGEQSWPTKRICDESTAQRQK